MTRWMFKRWVWATILGVTATVGATLAQQGGKDAPAGPPKVGDVMTLKFRDGPDRQIKVLKAEKQPDGSYLTEVKDVQSGEVFTLVDRTADTPATPTPKAPATTGKATAPISKAPVAASRPTPDAPKASDSGAPKAKSRMTDPLTPGLKDPMSSTPTDAKGGIDDRRLFGGASKSPAAVAGAQPNTPPEEERPGLLKRIFGRKKPAPSQPATATSNEPPRAGTSGAAMPPPVRPTPGTATAPPALTPGVTAEPPRTPGVRPATPPAVPVPNPTRFTPPASTQPLPLPLPNVPQPAPSVPPPTATTPAIPSVPAFPSTPTNPPATAPANTTPALPAIPSAPAAPAVPAKPLTPPVTPSIPAIPSVPAIPTPQTVPNPSGLPPIPVPPGGVSVARPPIVQAGYSPLAAPGVTGAMLHDLHPYITALQTELAPSQRATAVRAMSGCRHGTSDAVKDLILRTAQNDPAPMVRVACIEELCKLGYRSVAFTAYLKTACEDKNADVSAAAKSATAKLTPTK